MTAHPALQDAGTIAQGKERTLCALRLRQADASAKITCN